MSLLKSISYKILLKGAKMAFLELTTSEKPQLAVKVNNSLKYQDKEGNLLDRTKQTALTDIVREAGTVADTKRGAVSLSLNTKNGYQNFFVNKDENNNIVLKSMEDPKDESKYINFNKIDKENGTYYHILNDDNNSKELVDSINITSTEKSSYLSARITLKNDEIKQELIDKESSTNERHTVILSKDGYRIQANNELYKNSKEVENQQNESSKKKLYLAKDKKVDKDIER